MAIGQTVKFLARLFVICNLAAATLSCVRSAEGRIAIPNMHGIWTAPVKAEDLETALSKELPWNVHLLWIPPSSGEPNNEQTGKYYYLKIRHDWGGGSDAFDLETQLSPSKDAAPTIPFVYSEDDPAITSDRNGQKTAK